MMLLTVILASLLGYVNPFVGTDAHGHTFPGAAFPFGMVQLSPDTRPRAGDWDGCSGYHYSDSLIYGFSHTHLSGTGCDDLCDILVMPVTGYEGPVERDRYASPFSHREEIARPGYYCVWLQKPEVKARLAVGRRVAMHEYTFRDGAVPQIIIDLNHRDHMITGEISVQDNVVYGHRKSSSWSQDQDVYFAIECSGHIVSSRIEDGTAVLTFRPSRRSNIITLRAGISSVSAQSAYDNMMSEYPETFEALLAWSSEAWDNYLGKVECPFDESQEEERSIFYTALYHTAIHPSLYSDHDGGYRGMDREVYHAQGWSRYTVFSLWDTFRALHPLLCEIEPELTLDFINSFLAIYIEGGRLPVWELQGYETDCMIGYHSAPVFADALSRGLDDFNVDDALEALVVSSHHDGFGLPSFRANGLVLADDEHESVSKTLEYAYDDWCVAQVARWLIEHPDRTEFPQETLIDTYNRYMESSQYWRNVFDPSTGFMRARLNGRWLTPFNPSEVNNHYTEGNAWQYSFFVPHDVVGLMRAFGGPSGLVARIDSLFAAPEQTTGRTQADLTGMIGQYAHGNEPSHHIPHLYALAGRPDKAGETVRRIMTGLYSSAPDGLPGNDDAGQMSAWYVLSALGRYPVCPGAPLGTVTYVPKSIIVNPVFEAAGDIFTESMEVSIGNVEPGCIAFYKVGDGGFQPYEGPFTITATDSLFCYSVSPDGRSSFVTRSFFRKVRDDIKITLHSRYLRQYNAGGDDGLVDGMRGPRNWRTGGWQGYQDVDFEADIDLLSLREITGIGSGWLQDARSWIWMPPYVEYYASADGVGYTLVARIESGLPADDMNVQTADFTASFPAGLKARYIKVKAGKFGTIPDWHPGAGGDGIIFIDEIWVK